MLSTAQHARAFSEPAERDDPRNALLDTMALQIIEQIEAAARNDVLGLLLSRIEADAPALAKRLTAVKQATTAAVVVAPLSEDQIEQFKAASQRGAVLFAPSEDFARFDPMELSIVLTTLKLGDHFRMSRQHRDLFDRAREIVRGWIDAARRPHSVACEPPCVPATLGVWSMDAAGSHDA